MAEKTTPRIICPYCEDGRAFIWSAASKHVKAKHFEKWEEFKANKTMYLEKFACDESGNPVGGSPDPKPDPDPTPAPEPKPPAPEVKPPEPKSDPTPASASKPKPAEGGGFRGSIRRNIFGD